MNIYEEAFEKIKNNDLTVIRQLRQSNPILIFGHNEALQAYKVLKGKDAFKQLPSEIIQNNTNKDDRKCFVFNRTYDRRRLLTHCRYPHTVIVDIDAKRQSQIDNLVNDLGVTTLKQALAKLNNIFKNDPHCLLTSYSASGKGIKAIFQVVSEYWLKVINHHTQIKRFIEEGLQIPNEFKNYNIDVVNTWQDHNYKIVLEHLKNNNIVIHEDQSKEDNYLDPVAAIPVQPMYSVNSTGFHLNEDAYFLTSPLKDFAELKEEIKKLNKAKLKGKKNKSGDSATNERITKINQQYIDDLLIYLNSLSREKRNELIKNSTIKKYLSHYQTSYPVRYAAKFLNENGRKFIYTLFNKFYEGQAIHQLKNDFEAFNNHLDHKITGKYIEFLDSKINITVPLLFDDGKSDLFGNKYNTQLSFTNYVSDRKPELFTIFDNNKKTILRAKAGGGKTTLIHEYIDHCFSNGYKRIAFVIPKNSLNQQQETIILDRIATQYFGNDFSVCKNYGQGNHYNHSDYTTDEKVLILSSTPKLDNITKYCDLIVVDELQNLVAYSNEIRSNIRGYRGKLILMTATPEPYLIGLKMSKYHYVNLIKDGDKKKDIIVYVSKNHHKKLDELIDADRKQLIFYNDFDEHQYLMKKYNTSIEFFSLSTPESDKFHCKEVINNQSLNPSRKYIATSYISDGINFQNIGWNDLIIMDNGTVNIFEIYQLSERFRNVKNLNIYYVATPRIYSHYEPILFNELKDHVVYRKMINALKKEQYELNKLNKIGVELVDNKYLMKDDNKYILNKDALKLDLLNQYFNSLFQTNQQVFKELLMYYFNCVFDYKDIKKEHTQKSIIDNSKEIYKKYHNELSLIFDEITQKQKIDIKDVAILNNYIDRLRKYSIRKKEIEELEIEITDEILDKITLNQANYTTWSNNEKLRRLGNNTTGENLDSITFKSWNNQNKMKDIIMDSSFIHSHEYRKKITNFFLFSDLLDFFKSNESAYKIFVNSELQPEFLLNETSLGGYLRKITRHFKMGDKLTVDGKRIKVVKML